MFLLSITRIQRLLFELSFISCHMSVSIATNINWELLSVAYSHDENCQHVSTSDAKFQTNTLLISLTGEAEIFIYS